MIIITEIGCRSSNSCSQQQACINGVCGDPCTTRNPCSPHEECEVRNHKAACKKGKQKLIEDFLQTKTNILYNFSLRVSESFRLQQKRCL